MAKNQIVLCDTNIFIHLLNGRPATKKIFDNIGEGNVAYSIITYAEIIYGTKKSQLPIIRSFFDNLTEIHLDNEISQIFKAISLSYSYSQHIKIPDALIAATAIRYGFPLYTENKKDFDFIADLKLYN